jgi:hypothetical protein
MKLSFIHYMVTPEHLSRLTHSCISHQFSQGHSENNGRTEEDPGRNKSFSSTGK